MSICHAVMLTVRAPCPAHNKSEDGLLGDSADLDFRDVTEQRQPTSKPAEFPSNWVTAAATWSPPWTRMCRSTFTDPT